jgi:hypothetical protein
MAKFFEVEPLAICADDPACFVSKWLYRLAIAPKLWDFFMPVPPRQFAAIFARVCLLNVDLHSPIPSILSTTPAAATNGSRQKNIMRIVWARGFIHFSFFSA